jgi:hypothetical protein
MSSAQLYVAHDSVTDPGRHAGLYHDLPLEPSRLREVVSRLMIHVSWANNYGIPPNTPMPRDTLSVADRLALTWALAAGSLPEQRGSDKRSFGTCRDYALMLCSMLRHQSIPARVRCGFATYFAAGPYEDHWICEYWATNSRRWVRSDAQLDDVHRKHLTIDYDPADLPAHAFLTAGQAWKMARSGSASADAFGHTNAKGWWFLRVNVYRDLFALTNQYMSPWDTWRSSTPMSKVLAPADFAALDQLAASTEAIDFASSQFTTLKVIASRCQFPPWQS